MSIPDINRAAFRVPVIRMAACSRMPAEPSAAAAAAADAGGMAPAGESAFRSMMMARSPDVKQASSGRRCCAGVIVWPMQLSARLRTLSLASAKRSAQPVLTRKSFANHQISFAALPFSATGHRMLCKPPVVSAAEQHRAAASMPAEPCTLPAGGRTHEYEVPMLCGQSYVQDEDTHAR